MVLGGDGVDVAIDHLPRQSPNLALLGPLLVHRKHGLDGAVPAFTVNQHKGQCLGDLTIGLPELQFVQVALWRNYTCLSVADVNV